MKRTIQIVAAVMILLGFSAVSAKADGTELTYTLIQNGSSTPLATWQMPLNPTPTCNFAPPCFASGDFFAENVEISINGTSPISDTLIFLNTTSLNVDLSDLDSGPFDGFLLPELNGAQLYMNDESIPQMIVPATGSFNLTDDLGNNYTLDVVATPEPATLLLLGSGILALGIRKRRASR